ncbi:hypothetical protein PHYSODRAFT_305826 [Phytophthora sojae]|uniref:Uncharacterized protein n=1 Tax=Phytophthora sojae (strain P6497) TaxID=1094619 RepID=G5A6S7_PHYSP|nr:hypothetical protein PHYSODRAFT_305826 [Phytophthora sojae]EGZ09032.1 hypothetical protein PHYSODRAFT_305826 [Phytophthora sojae]|eukprot:XP_009535665.1 hypothetical protein PHYSODRAFT_305826 [Phytophthora sojae]
MCSLAFCPQTETNAGLARRHERVITPHCQRPELQRGGGDFQAKTPSSEEARQRQLYRVNQKLERDDLRRQVVELVDQHARMKQAQANEKARFKASRPPAYYLWKSFALRQREERQLMAAVNTQATYIDALSSIARKRLRSDQESSSVRSKINGPDVEEMAIFDSCIRELHANYERADEVLWSCSIDELGTDGAEVQPYSLYETGCSLWNVSDRYCAAKIRFKRYEGVTDPENTFAATFIDKIALGSGEVVEVRQRLVSCRFFEERRIVVTWKFISETQGV